MRAFAIAVVLAGSLVATAARAQATCAGFTDVPAASQFCANIAWVKNRGITAGCTSTTLYCPTQFVTREQMAAFLNRLGDALFPTTCASGQVLRWNGSAWTCADAAPAAGAGRPARIEALHGAAGTGQFSSLAIGTDGVPLIAYFDQQNGDLRLARCTTIACAAATDVLVDGAGVVGHWPSITVRSDGRAAVSYYDVTNTALKVAFCSDAACTSAATYTVDNAGDVGRHSSIVADWGSNAQGVTIAYFDATNRNLKAARCGTSGACASPTVVTLVSAGDVGEWSAATVDGYGRLAVAFFDATNKNVKVAYCDFDLPSCAPPFTRVLASTGVGTIEGLAVSTSGHGGLAFSYLLRGDPPFDSPVIGACTTPQCDATNVQRYLNFGTGSYPAGQPGSIATGPDGVPLALFSLSPSGSCASSAGGIATNEALRCTDAACTGATFVNHVGFGMAPSVTFGVDGLPLFSYWRCGQNRLATVHCSNVACAAAHRPR